MSKSEKILGPLVYNCYPLPSGNVEIYHRTNLKGYFIGNVYKDIKDTKYTIAKYYGMSSDEKYDNIEDALKAFNKLLMDDGFELIDNEENFKKLQILI